VVTFHACQTQIVHWQMGTQFILPSLMSLVTTYQGTGQRVGINTGISIPLTAIYHGSFSTNSVIFILRPHQRMQRCPSNFMVSRKLSSKWRILPSMEQTYNSCVFRKTHREPIKTRSAVDGQEICLKLYCNCGPGDNPTQSEICGHIGAKGNYPCRKCNVGGSQKEKETDQGFHNFFSVSRTHFLYQTSLD